MSRSTKLPKTITLFVITLVVLILGMACSLALLALLVKLISLF